MNPNPKGKGPPPHPIVCCHQPNFVPYIGFFDKVAKSDICVLADEVQYTRGFTNRNRIMLPYGKVAWLTIPTAKSRIGTQIDQVRVAGDKWKIKHTRLLKDCYQKAPFFSEYYNSLLEQVYDARSELLVDYNLASIHFIMNVFGIRTKLIRMNELGVDSEYKKTDLAIALVRAVGGRTYLSGDGARAYLDVEKLVKGHVPLLWHNFEHPVYSQLGAQFTPYLSILDYLFNVGNRPW